MDDRAAGFGYTGAPLEPEVGRKSLPLRQISIPA
jgi:hypothetical protein